MNARAAILAVTDSPGSLVLLAAILAPAGYDVRSADGGELALDAVAANQPDLILLDDRLQDMDALEVCRRLKDSDETRHIPIILVSTFADATEWPEGLRLGAADYITKPFQAEELLARVETHLSLSRATASLEQQALALRQANAQLQAEIVGRRRMEDELRQGLDRAERSRRAMLSALEDEKRAEESRHLASERLRRMVDSNIVGIVIADAAGSVVEANDYYLRLVGFAREELEHGHLDWRTITPPEWLPADEQAIRELRERGTCTPYEKEYVRRDGTRVPVFLADTLLPGPEGLIAAFALDITERKQAEAQAAARALQQEAIADLDRQALSGVGLPELREQAVQRLARELDVELCQVLELLPDRSALLLRAGVGWQEGLVGRATVGVGPDSLAGFTLASGGPVVVDDLRTDQRFRGPSLLHDRDVISSMSTIIGDPERPYGVLGAHSTRPKIFTDHDVHFLRGVANLLGSAVQRDAHEAEIRRMNRLYATLSQVNEAVVRCTSREELFPELCRVAVQHGGFSAAWVGLSTGEAGQVTVVARDAAAPDTLLVLPDQTRGCGVVAEAVRTGLPCVANDGRHDERIASCAVLSLAGIGSCAAFPFLVGADGGGAFAVSSVDTGFFNADEIGLLAEVAADVTYALEHLAQDARRRQTEEALRESEERYRELVENLHDVIFASDSEGIITYVSSPVRELTGYEPDDLVGHPLAVVVHSDDLPELERKFRDIRKNQLEPWEFRYRTRDGQIRWARTSIRPIVEDDRVVGLRGTFSDITERVRTGEEQARLAEQVRQAQRMKSVGRLAGGVAHDFNNMLSVVLGYGEILLDRLAPDDPARIEVQAIVTAGRRAEVLTRQLLALGRRQTLRPEVLDLNAVVLGLEKLLRRLVGEAIDVELRLADDAARVIVDPGQIEQVIINLVANARDAMPKGGRLTIGTASIEFDEAGARHLVDVTPGKYVMLTVTDTGHGMDEETLSRVFEPFFTTKGKGKGTGLGLSTVYGVVTQSGGSIAVHSEPGRGSTFTIYLRQTETEPEAPAPPDDEAEPGGEHAQVLVVEDEPSLLLLVERVLSGFGYRVSVAANGLDAIGLVERDGSRPDLLLTDVVMPGMSGPELADRLRRTLPHLEVLYMSGYPDEAVVGHGLPTRGAHLIQKPFSKADLAARVREALRAGARKRARDRSRAADR